LPDETEQIPLLIFREVDKSTWPDFVRLFEGRGGPRYCWCMVWRPMEDESKRSDRPAKRAEMERRVGQGVPVGILGYVDGEPVAWCSIAPRETYRKGLGGLKEPGDAPGAVWSLACMFIARPFRGKGVTRQLINAAIAHARSKGATVVEAYPVDPDSPSYRFMGFVGTFKAMGFEEVGREETRRYVVRRGVT
jgi:GNAT superfamily N-acetyltransferase